MPAWLSGSAAALGLETHHCFQREIKVRTVLTPTFSICTAFKEENPQKLPKQPEPTHLLDWEAITMSMVSTPIPMMLMTACPASVLARLKMHRDCRLGALLWHKHRTVSPGALWHFATLHLENYHKVTFSFLHPHWSFFYSPFYFHQSTTNRKVDGRLSQEIYLLFFFFFYQKF